MRVNRRTILAVTGTSIGLAGCIGEDEAADDEAGADEDDETATPEDSDGEDSNDSDSADDSTSTIVQMSSHPEHGDILVDSDEMTLYMFDQDTQGEPESACYDDCANNWPPLTVEDDEPTAGEEVMAELTTFERDDGSMQVAADGWPLYYFAPDEEPGDATGQGVNDVWWVLRPDGTPVRPDESDDDGSDDGY